MPKPVIKSTSEGLVRLVAHMKRPATNRHGVVKAVETVTMWRENPFVIVEVEIHLQCNECWGIIQQITHAGGWKWNAGSEAQTRFKYGLTPLRRGAN